MSPERPSPVDAHRREGRLRLFAVAVGVILATTLVVGPTAWRYVESHGFPPDFFDLQGFLASDNATPALIYNVAAVEQTPDCPYGVAYLLNGVTTDGYWFQDGLAWNWRDGGEGRFTLIYDVFNSVGAVIDPAGGGAGFAEFGTSVHPGDMVRIVLAVANGSVEMNAFDESTKSIASHNPPGTTSPGWIGAFLYATQAGTIFTGLMTECYRAAYGDATLQQVTFSDLGAPVTNAQLCVDERDFSNGSYPIGLATKVPLSCGGDLSYSDMEGHSFGLNGFELAANATSFSSRSP